MYGAIVFLRPGGVVVAWRKGNHNAGEYDLWCIGIKRSVAVVKNLACRSHVVVQNFSNPLWIATFAT
jgi:hypothetical protein